ncbi:MAG: N-formylglutamate amidohydrolase [Pseudomonadota bacterium]
MSVTALEGPADPAVPLILDSPHSGANYPSDFAPIPAMARVRRAEDFAVDALFGAAPELGLPLYKALFPRIVVDVNRARDDIDPKSVTGELPFSAAPSAKAALGKGVVWMSAPPPPEPTPLYVRPLPAEEVVRRLATYWTPYRDGLAAHIERLRSAHGRAYYLDCHSMQSVSTTMHEEGAGIPRAEIVLGDRDGTACAPEFTAAVAKALADEGFDVAINKPYKGADLVRAHGAPAEGVHALQIEVRRDLYMDEAALRRSSAFQDTRARLGRALAAIAACLREDGP